MNSEITELNWVGCDKLNAPNNPLSSLGLLEALGSDGRCRRNERDAVVFLGDDVDGCPVRLPVAIEDLVSPRISDCSRWRPV